MYGLYALDSLSSPETGPASIQFLDAENLDRAVPVVMTTASDVARVTRGIRNQLTKGIANIDADVITVTGRVLDAGEGVPMLLTKMDGRDRLIALDFDHLPGASNFDFDDHIEVTATGALRGRTMQPFHLKLRKMELEPDTSFDI